ncbi:MAG: ribosomal L7Ae/L30e/S12e/Gadd45 family protein [Clostridia bacterium]|nr:ribosomal L7Ae/L30e/S12e/Gadd45 family protein [Clostridia bacterium]
MENAQILTKLLSLAGLCRRAGGVVPGADSVISQVQRGGKAKTKCVIMSSRATDRTKKQITDKCRSAEVALYVIDADPYDMGEKLGLKSSLAVFALTGKGPWAGAAELAEQLKVN